MRSVLVAMFVAGLGVACAPPTLPAGADQGVTNKGSSGDDDSTTDPSSGDDDSTNNSTSKSTTNTSSGPPATFTTLYNDLKPSCGTCHASGGTGPTFFGADEATTYTDFKTQGFNKSGGMTIPSGHPGGELTDDQTTALNAWVTAEGG